MHLFEFLLRDFFNTEAYSKPSSVILMHDCLPNSVDLVTRHFDGGAWTGDVWKVVEILEHYRPDLRVWCVHCAPTGIICVGNLDPSSRLLQNRYFEIADKYIKRPNDQGALEAFYQDRELTPAADIFGFDQSRYLGPCG